MEQMVMRRRLISALIATAAALLFVYAVARYVIGQSNLRAAKRYQTEHPGRFVDLGRPHDPVHGAREYAPIDAGTHSE